MRRVASFALLVLVAGAGAAILFESARTVLGEPLAGTLALGLGVGAAVYLDRRYLWNQDRPMSEALKYGLATSFGWAIAQALLILV